ncbi:MAG: sensor histidine kinase [Solirubrobacteraceae bacterium]
MLAHDSRSRRVIALPALAAIIYSIGQGRTGFALTGRGLSVLLLSTAASVGWTAWVTLWRPTRAVAAALALLAGAGAALTAALTPAGIAFVFPFVAVLVAARMFPLRPAAAVSAAGVAGVLAAYPAVGKSAAQTLGVCAGLIAALLAGQNLREYRVRQEQAEMLLAETQRAQEEQRRSATFAERARIAREIHDVLAHSLSALSIHLEGARMLFDHHDDSDRERLADQLDRAHRLAVEGLEETRRAIGALRGDALPLPELLAQLLGEPGVTDARPHIEGQPRPLSPDAALAIYRTAQEALTNARKHAPDALVEIRLAFGPAQVTLTVLDRRPVGMPQPSSPLAQAGGGYGLTGMQERAELLEGSLQAGATDTGWRVQLILPA